MNENKKKIKYIILFFSTSFLSCSIDSISQTSDDENILSFSLDNGMFIEVLLPESYTSELQYPVLFFNDGELVFKNDEWNIDTRIIELIDENEIVPIIVVAIYSQGKRNNWYIPYEDDWIVQNWGTYTPEAESYSNEILTTIIPFLEQKFSINKTEVGIIGASLGGLISTWMGLKFPNQIKYSASISGSFWVNEYELFNDVKENYINQKFWFDIGTKEWNYIIPLYKQLDFSGAKPGKQSFYYEVKDGRHLSVDWLDRINNPLKLFFGMNQEISPVSMEVLLECIPSHSMPGIKFRRMNPIVTLSNGVVYSLAHTATYTLESDTGKIGDEGSFINNPEKEMKVNISFEEFSKEVIIPVGFCK